MGAGGFVNQAFRNMINWKWYYDPPVRILFYHLLTIANEDDKIENGICVKTGNVLTTISKLGKETLLTPKQIRIALSKLSSANEISIITSRQNGTIINITEWLKYKSNDTYRQNDDNASNIGKGNQRANEGQMEVVDNKNNNTANEKRGANEGQTDAEKEPQNEHEGNQRANEGQMEVVDNQSDKAHLENQRANEGQTEISLKEPEKEDIPPIPPIEVKDQEKDIIKEKILKKENKEKHPFDAFWHLYGKKVDRQACERKWAKLSEKDKEAIMAYLPEYIARTPNVQYRRDPLTFLNKRTWENDLPQQPIPSQQMLPFSQSMSYGDRKRQQAGQDVSQIPGFIGKEVDFDKDAPDNPF